MLPPAEAERAAAVRHLDGDAAPGLALAPRPPLVTHTQPRVLALELQTIVYSKVRNHREDPYQGLLLVESFYYTAFTFHIKTQ